MKKTIIYFTLMVLSSMMYAQTVTIGTQVWMTKNLDVATFRNGDPIPEAKTNEEWKKAGENKQPAFCYYDNNPSNGAKYGKLYNWYAVNDPRGLAPVGYHIPADEEWRILINFLDPESNGGDSYNNSAGVKLKANFGWEEDGGGTNESGFSGLPGGSRGEDGKFSLIGGNGSWWNSSCFSDSTASFRYVCPNQDVFSGLWPPLKSEGYSVRCIKGEDISIGDQIWMSKNLNSSIFRNGDLIFEAKTNEEWMKANNEKKPAWCYFDNDPENGEKYGKLYNWYAVNDPRGLAPVGYHIPTDSEWTILTDYIASSGRGIDWLYDKEYGSWYTEKSLPNVGLKLKSTRGWVENRNGTNESGFNGLPGGYRNNDGAFSYVGSYGSWWSSAEPNASDAWLRYLYYEDGFVHRYVNDKEIGLSVRCLRD